MASSAPVDIGTLIEKRPGFRGGRPVIVGTGTHVHALAALYRAGMSGDEVVAEFDHLPRGHVYAALAYYLANRDEIDGYLAEDSATYDELSRPDSRKVAPSPQS